MNEFADLMLRFAGALAIGLLVGAERLRLIAQSPCHPLGRPPDGREHDGEFEGDLPPQDLGR